MPPRFYAPALTGDSSTVILPPGESVHLARVLRLTPGTPVEVLDGRGTMRAGVVVEARARGAVVRVGSEVEAQPEPPVSITVVTALLKGDAMDAVVRDATVLGATRLVPLLATRSNVSRVGLQSGRTHERWHRVAVAAAKQCGRAVVPVVAPVSTLEALIAAGTGEEPALQRLLLVEPALEIAASRPPLRVSETWLMVGPEGGWTGAEVERACAAGWSPWTLGPFTVRAEQVTFAALAVLRYAWQE